MSTFHNAAYEALSVPRGPLAERIGPVLERQGVEFLHDIRGLRWNTELGRFRAELEWELEGVPDFDVAVAETEEWECACLDIRFLNRDCELYLYRGRAELASTQSMSIDFPQSLYDESLEDEETAARWIGLLVDLGKALDNATMVCGSDVPKVPADPRRLLARLEHFLAGFEEEAYGVHAALLHPSRQGETVRAKARSVGFSAANVGPDYELLALLKYDREILQAVLGA